MNNETKSEPLKNFKIGITESKPFEIPDIKDGVFDGILVDMELKTDLPDGKGGKFDMLQWNFEVDGKEIKGKTSTVISNLSKAYQWITALTGKEPQMNKDFSPEYVKGKKCTVVIKHQKKQREFNNEKIIQNIPYVHDVLPEK
jgi:hypothetical protein